MKAPLAWFRNPHLTKPTPLTVTADGQVFGHAAVFDVCHVGLPDRCVTVPTSTNLYRAFHRRRVDVGGGRRVTVGTITFGMEHPALTASAVQTVYALLSRGVPAAEVRCGEDEHGVWVNGRVLQAGANLRGAHLSGDWRTVDGRLELVGLLVVDSPGFPVRHAEGDLVAGAGQSEPVVAALTASAPVLIPRPAGPLIRRPEPTSRRK